MLEYRYMALSKDELKAIGDLVKAEIQLEVSKIEEKIEGLPTKDEFYTKMDEVMGELKDIREEVALVSRRSSDHEDRITSLEEIHPEGRHAAN